MKGALVAAGLAGAFFGLFAAAGLTWLDAGELGAAAWELGIAHPPGFPVFTQLHGLVMHLVPFGDAAFRGALASGLLPKALNWLGVATAVGGMATLAPGFEAAEMVFGLGSIAWFVWIGVALLRDRTA